MTFTIPPQSQDHQPGVEKLMKPLAVHIRPDYKGSGKLDGKKALITGGDSGIGRAAALHFAREGADVSILYFDEHEDAQETVRLIEAEGRKALAIAGDVSSSAFCNDAVAETVKILGGLDIIVNNAGVQYVSEDLTDITDEVWQHHMNVNINGYFYITRAALPHLKRVPRSYRRPPLTLLPAINLWLHIRPPKLLRWALRAPLRYSLRTKASVLMLWHRGRSGHPSSLPAGGRLTPRLWLIWEPIHQWAAVVSLRSWGRLTCIWLPQIQAS